MLKDYLILGVRSLVKRRTRTYLTMIGIFIGIAAVVSLMGLGEGLRIAILSQFGLLGTDVLSVRASGLDFAGPPGFGAPDPLTKDLADKIENVAGVEVAINRYLESATMEFNDLQTVAFIASIPIGDQRKIFEEMLNFKVDKGRLLKEGDGRRVVIGSNLNKDDNEIKKKIDVGDKILLKGISYDVVGILKKKGSFIIDSTIFLDEDVLLDDIREDDETVNIIGVKVKDEKQIDQVQINIEKLLRKERNVKEGEENFIVESPQKALESLNSTLLAVQMFITVIAVISLLVGGIGIMNTMYTSVLERRKEIGIMKAVGARNSTIFTIFSIESGLLGLVGGVIGVLLGLIFAYGLAFIGKTALGSDLIQAHVSLSLIIGALLFAFILGTGFGVLPAYQASKMRPIESLRAAK